MTSSTPRGVVYRCPVCGAELVVLGRRMGRFTPRCCNTNMARRRRRISFYVCPVCGAEIAVIGRAGREFAPRCCNTAMLLAAA